MKRMLRGAIIGWIIGTIVAVLITYFFNLTIPWSFINGIICGGSFTLIGIQLFK